MVVPHRLFFSFFILLITVASCAAEDDESASVPAVRPTQILQFPGVGVDLDAKATRVSLAARGEGLKVFDATQPNHLVDLANAQLPFVYRTMLTDTHVIGFDEERGLSVAPLAGLGGLNLTNALSNIELRGFVSAVVGDEKRLLTANGATGLQVHTGDAAWHLTRQASPQAIPTTAIDHLALSDAGIVAADASGTIALYDNESLALIAWQTTEHPIHDLSCIAKRCFATSPRHGVQVFDLTPESITHLRTIAFAKTVDRVVATPEFVFVSFVGLRSGFGAYTLRTETLTSAKTLHTMERVTDIAHRENSTYVLLAKDELHVYLNENFY